jgi:hypothetical protein
LTGRRRGRILSRVPPTAAEAETVEQPKRLRMTRSFYLRPDQAKAIEDACLDLPAILREPMSPSKVMERFIDDCFADWLSRVKAPAPASRKKSKGGDEGGR